MTNNIQFNEHYDKMIIDLPQDQLMRMCSLNKGLAEYYKNVFCGSLKYYELVRDSSPEELDRLKDDESYFKKYCDLRMEMIAGIMLKKYKVDYADPGNLIYSNCTGVYYCPTNFSIESMKFASNGEIDFVGIYGLFLDYYEKEEINCSKKGITSIPELPNLKKLDCSDNELESLPHFANLEELICHNNKFSKFPGEVDYCSFLVEYGFDMQKYSNFPKLRLFNGETNFNEQLGHAYGKEPCRSPLDDKFFIGSMSAALIFVAFEAFSWIRSRL